MKIGEFMKIVKKDTTGVTEPVQSNSGSARCRLQKFNGIAVSTFYVHLKETEFRFNHPRDTLIKINPL